MKRRTYPNPCSECVANPKCDRETMMCEKFANFMNTVLFKYLDIHHGVRTSPDGNRLVINAAVVDPYELENHLHNKWLKTVTIHCDHLTFTFENESVDMY